MFNEEEYEINRITRCDLTNHKVEDLTEKLKGNTELLKRYKPDNISVFSDCVIFFHSMPNRRALYIVYAKRESNTKNVGLFG